MCIFTLCCYYEKDNGAAEHFLWILRMILGDELNPGVNTIPKCYQETPQQPMNPI